MGALTAGGSLARLLAWRVAEAPGRGFMFVEDDGPWTFGQLAAAAVGYRRELAAAGVGPGDRVALRVGNDERFLPAAMAIWCAEGVVVPIHPATPPAEVERVIGAMGVRALIADNGDTLVPEVPVIRCGQLAAHNRPDTGDQAAQYRAPQSAVGDQPALILLTSGSTGAPKGVVLTHDNAWTNLRATVSAFRSNPEPTPLAAMDKAPNLIANPLSHTAGVIRLLYALYVGRPVALLRKFDGRQAKRAIDRHRIDNLTINPAMLRILLDSLVPGEDLGAVRYVSSGTAPLSTSLREEFETRFGVPVLQAYGQTEAFGAVCIESARDVLAGRRRPGSVGRPLPGVELRIVDPDGVDVTQGADGEIWVRTRSSTAGYLGAGTASPVDAVGWLHTGDLGALDADGYLFITGRLKNIVICGGFNIVPEELEAALAVDASVRDAVVVGLPDDRLGEIPVALVESSDSAEQVLARVQERLAPYKRPRRVHIVDLLPRVPNGKVDRGAAGRLAVQLNSDAGLP